MKVPKFPNVSTLTTFRMELYDRAMVCAQDKKFEKVVKWLQVAEKEGLKLEEVPRPKRKYETLDRKMALALQSILPRDLEMRVNTDKAKALEKGELLSGRQILWHIYKHFQTSPNQTRIYTLMDVVNIKWFGDKSKEKFLTFWNDRMSQVAGRVEDWMKAEVLYRALTVSEDLKVEMLAYRSKYPNNIGEELGQERYDAMMDILYRRVVMERQEENRVDRETRDRRFVERFSKSHEVAMPAPAKGGGRKGKANNRSKSRKGKGEGKGKDKPRSKSAKGSRKGKGGKGGGEEKGLCVNWVVSGSCARGAECRYRHERATNDTDEKYYRELHTRIASRSKSPAPKGKGRGVCRQWQTDKSCRFGKECRYRHDEDPAAPVTKATGRASSRTSSRGRKSKTSTAAPATAAICSSTPSGAGGNS